VIMFYKKIQEFISDLIDCKKLHINTA